MVQSRSNAHLLYKTIKPSIAKRIGRMVMEQAVSDLLRIPRGDGSVDRAYKDARYFFENHEYDFFCECAELSPVVIEEWFDALDT